MPALLSAHVPFDEKAAFRPVTSLGAGAVSGDFVVAPSVGFRWTPVPAPGRSRLGIRLDGEFPVKVADSFDILERVVLGVTYVF